MSQHLDNVKTRFTYDLFLFDGKEHQRLTKFNSLISDVSMSFDGGLVGVVIHPHIGLVIQPHKRFPPRELKLLNVKTGRIEMLDPATLFGKQTAIQ